MRSLFAVVPVVVFVFSACRAGGDDEPSGSVAGDLHAFQPTKEGGGIFGEWIVDRYGLPAFSYTLDQRRDPRGKWPNSEELFPIRRERRDHFHVTGNDRLNLLAVDDGYVQLFSNERGPTWLNRFDDGQGNGGGGYSYVKDGADAYATAFRWAPEGAETRRVFGIGYYETENTWRGVTVRHRIHAPDGDAPFVIDDVEIVNASGSDKDLTHYEYWDVNRHQIAIDWVRTGLAAGISDRRRDGLNARFVTAAGWDGATLRVTNTPLPGQAVPPPDAIDAVDWYPPPVFLEHLGGDAPIDEVYTDQRTFLGGGGLARPDAVVTPRAGEVLAPTWAAGQPAMLAMASRLRLAGGGTRRLRFAYGYEPAGIAGAERARGYAAAADPLEETARRWKQRLAYVDVAGASPHLHREIAWRTATLLSNTVTNDFYHERYTPQGSAYLYLHGADGVPRDQSLFALATTYLDPSLAKGTLRLVMQLTDPDSGQTGYSFTGHGVTEGALIHEKPSDLDLFFFLGLAEYLAATGDRGFLAEEVPFHPRRDGSVGLPPGATGRTVLDHVRAALRHLVDEVGVGDHGLVRLSDGDWSDGIAVEDLSPTAIYFTTRHGESIPNSQMALHVLPLLAGLIEGDDPALAGALRGKARALEAPVRAAFGTRWFGRAWVRNTINQGYLKGTDAEDDPFHAGYINLEAQPWGLLSGVLGPAETTRLLDEVEQRLDADSAIGPRLAPGGSVWPAISQLMTWAYARHRPEAAWRSIDEHLYATHARQNPEQWIGVLSGPDGFETWGGTWASPVTPMTDFPVANMNPEAMMLVGLLRAAGVEPTTDGLLISPRGGARSYTLDLPLLRLDVSPGRVAGTYRAKNDGVTELRVVVPGKTVRIPLSFAKGDEVPFDVRY